MNYKFILKASTIIILSSTVYIMATNLPEKFNTNTSSSTIEDLIDETNFKLEFKNLNELEYTVQDPTVDIKNTGFNKSFFNNNKFDILITENGKISSISYISETSQMNSIDLEYLQKIYNFVFENLSSFIFEESNKMIKKVQSLDYINSNKTSISENGYTIESIKLNKTSEIRITTYYENKQNEIIAYKIAIDILQGNKW